MLCITATSYVGDNSKPELAMLLRKQPLELELEFTIETSKFRSCDQHLGLSPSYLGSTQPYLGLSLDYISGENAL